MVAQTHAGESFMYSYSDALSIMPCFPHYTTILLYYYTISYLHLIIRIPSIDSNIWVLHCFAPILSVSLNKPGCFRTAGEQNNE